MEESARRARTRDEAAEAARFAEQIKESADQMLADGADRGDVKLVARALQELADSFSMLIPYRHRPKVSIFGSARTQAEQPEFQHAVRFARAIIQQGFMVITGAGPGIMEAGHVGATVDHSIGLNILLPFESVANDVIAQDEKLIDLNYFFTRKLLFLKETDALALYPGGFGTLDEGFELLTMLQCGKAQMMPVVMIDVPGGDYWKRWYDFVKTALLEKGMISPQDLSLFRITDSVDEAVEEIVQFYRVYHSQRFVRGRLALRLHSALPDELLDRINVEFRDILSSGDFRQGKAHPHEANDPHVADKVRLHFHFDRKSHGRLRELIDLINREG